MVHGPRKSFAESFFYIHLGHGGRFHLHRSPHDQRHPALLADDSRRRNHSPNRLREHGHGRRRIRPNGQRRRPHGTAPRRSRPSLHPRRPRALHRLRSHTGLHQNATSPSAKRMVTTKGIYHLPHKEGSYVSCRLSCCALLHLSSLPTSPQIIICNFNLSTSLFISLSHVIMLNFNIFLSLVESGLSQSE